MGQHSRIYILGKSDLEAWDEAHKIRSHRRSPTFSLRRPMAVMLVLSTAALLLNASTLPDERTLPATSTAVAEPPKISTLDLPTLTGTEVDRENPRVSRGSAREAAIPPPPPAPSKIEIVISYALAQQGDSYIFGAAGPNAFDCSGLVMMAFKQVGISLPHFTGTMISRGQRVSRAAMQRGDIVFLSDHHVALYLGNGMMVAASSGQGHVVVQKVYAFYAARRLL